METATNAPICKTQVCKRPLTYLEESKCWRCLICNPIPKAKPSPEEKTKYLDVKVTEERVREIIKEQGLGEERIREIVQDELMNWHIQKPSVGNITVTESGVAEIEPVETWRQKAKRLGVRLMKEPKGTGARTKEEVLADIEKIEETQTG